LNLPVRTTPEADAHIRDIDDWWRTNRCAALDLFLDELAGSFDMIRAAPQIGRLYRRSPVPGTHRLLLTLSRYHVYYVPRPADIMVLAVWHARRGVGPPLRMPETSAR
jgi:plasmid stabilization system protein ParE